MKILFVHERFGALAGAEANIYIAASEFKRGGHIVGILHGAGTGKSEEAWSEIFSSRYALDEKKTTATAEQALREFRPDIVYVHKMADLPVIEVLLNSGLPLVRMVHDHAIYCMRNYKYFYGSRKICTRAAGPYCIFPCGAFIARNHEGGFPIKWVSYLKKKKEIRLNQQFHRTLVVSDYMRQELLQNGFDPYRIEIHPPVPRMSDASLRSNFGERNLIIYAGQIIRGKGVDVLLESLALLKTRFECIILGDGSHRSYCEKLKTRLGLNGRVRFAGFVPQEELKNYYRECTVFTISSVWPEPFATVGVEVMRYGIPVVAFEAGGIKDWLIDGCNGYLVPWMDRVQYAARLETLLNNKSLARQMGEQGRMLVNKHYDFPNYIRGLEEMFARVAAEVSSVRRQESGVRNQELGGVQRL